MVRPKNAPPLKQPPPPPPTAPAVHIADARPVTHDALASVIRHMERRYTNLEAVVKVLANMVGLDKTEVARLLSLSRDDGQGR